MRRRTVLTLALVAVVAGAVSIGGLELVRNTPYIEPQAGPRHTGSTALEMAYVHRYWLHKNTAEYGDFGGTDCVNFVSQALYARGWAMDAQWGHSKTLGFNGYSKAWVSSTALERYLAARPRLATPLTDAQRAEVRVGDVVQLDWDSSGDRDHPRRTAATPRAARRNRLRGPPGLVTKVVHRSDGSIEIDMAEHSPSSLYRSVDVLLAEHAHPSVYYWHLI